MANQYDYYYGNETEQFRFYQIPKDLIDSPRFLKLSIDAKVLYSVLRDRMQLSRENGWIDEEKRVFLIFKIEEIAKMMGVCVEKSVKLLKDLESFGLVEKVRRGQGLASIIYVRNFAAPIGDETEPEESTDEDQIALENPSQNPINALNSEKPNSRIRKNRKQEFGKTEDKNSENPNSRNRKNRIPEIGNTESNDNDYKDTDISDTDRSISQSGGVQDIRPNERPIITVGANEALDEREITKCKRTLSQHRGIPYSLVLSAQSMKEMILFLCCGSCVRKRGLKRQEEMTLRLIVESLSEMALERELWDCRGSRICYRHVIDKLNVILQEQEGYYLHGFVDRVMDKYFEGCKGNYIGNPKQYIKAILWSEMCCYSVEEDSYYSKMVYDDMGLGFPR